MAESCPTFAVDYGEYTLGYVTDVMDISADGAIQIRMTARTETGEVVADMLVRLKAHRNVVMMTRVLKDQGVLPADAVGLASTAESLSRTASAESGNAPK
jgi:hypothetical protein